MASLTLTAPAKLNLYLAVTGRRADGFHDLVSVAAPLVNGDTLTVDVADGAPPSGQQFSLTCTDPAVPEDDTNLVWRAAAAFAQAAGWNGTARFRLEKSLPVGAGLGGGSSDAVAALRALNQLNRNPLPATEIAALAATLGSDCPLFLQPGPVIMRGRGERVEPLPVTAAARVRGRSVLVFKPAFGISTAWAYQRLAAQATAAPDAAGSTVYVAAEEAEHRLSGWIANPTAPAEALLFNNLERPAFEKYLALSTLLDQLREQFNLQPRMSGSGSACFAFLPDQAPIDQINATIRAAWGDSTFILVSRLA